MNTVSIDTILTALNLCNDSKKSNQIDDNKQELRCSEDYTYSRLISILL